MMNEKRSQKMKRFLFVNGLSLITLLTVAVAAGRVLQKIEDSEKILNVLTADVLAIKLKLAGYDVDFSYLRRGTGAIRERGE